MGKSEIRIPKKNRTPKPELSRGRSPTLHSVFGLRFSLGFRISLFRFRFNGLRLAQFFKRRQRRFAFGGFFALAGAARQFDAAMVDGAFKEAVVVRPAAGNDMVLRGFRGARLKKFLQFTLRVFQNWDDVQFAERGAKFTEDEIARGLIAAVQENSAHERLEGVGERGGALASAVQVLATTEDETFAQAQFAPVHRQRAPVHEFRPGLGERTLVRPGKFFIEFAGKGELE